MNRQTSTSRDAAADMLAALRSIVGRRFILTGERRTKRYRKGFRVGVGTAAAVILPGSLVEQWRVLQVCVAFDAVVIMQAANTGLTGGSVPDGDDYDRPVIVINTRRLDRIDLIDDGKQVVCLPGATLYGLEARLKAVGRLPHSVIGSSCLGASVIGGIANNSGGSLIQRGPAYTELSLYAQVDADGRLGLVNNLGLDLGSTPDEILGRLDDKAYPGHGNLQSGRASDSDYATRVRQIDEPTPARFNANPANLHGASGSAGKVAIFAVRLDTFEKNAREKTFYIGTNSADALTDLRRHMLGTFANLPVAAEYMHRDCFDSARRFGKDTYLMIDRLGTDRMPTFFNLKGSADAFFETIPFLPDGLTDRVLQLVSGLVPNLLPQRLIAFRDRYEHHLILKMAGDGIDEALGYLSSEFGNDVEGGWFECSDKEAASAFLLRFSAAGAAIRQAIVSGNGASQLVALDIALTRSDRHWREELPASLKDQCDDILYYGHFFCHVFHQDYILKPGVDAAAFKNAILEFMDSRGAEYPAEHNVGHVYKAKPSLAEFYKTLDPCNMFNPGIGKTSQSRRYGCDCGPTDVAAKKTQAGRFECQAT